MKLHGAKLPIPVLLTIVLLSSVAVAQLHSTAPVLLVQFSTSNRWGDYSSMAIDPSDDCTFWYAQEYILASGSFNWSTRLASFKLGNCQ